MPLVYSAVRQCVRGDRHRGVWRALLILALSLLAGILLSRVMDDPSARSAFVACAVSSAAVAVFAFLMLFRMTFSPLAVFAAIALGFDVLSLTMQLLPAAAWLASSPDPLLLLLVYPTLVLAGSWYTGTVRRPWRRRLRVALAALAFGAGLAVVKGSVALSLWVAMQMGWPEWAGGYPAHVAIQSLLLFCLFSLYRGGDRLAGWLLLSVLPGISAGVLLAWYGDQSAAAISMVRVGGYLIAGAGAWSGIRVCLSRATTGQVAMNLAERIRDAVTGSVDPDVMARSVAREIAAALGFDEIAVLLRTPDQRGLYIAGSYGSRPSHGSDAAARFSPGFEKLVLDTSTGHRSPSDGRGGSCRQVSLPLMVRDEELGIMIASRRSLPGISEAERALLDVALAQFAVGVANAQLLGQSRWRLNRTEVLHSLAVQASGPLSVDELGELVMQHAKRLTASNHAELFLLAESGKFLRTGDGTAMPDSDLYERVLQTRRVQVSGSDRASIAAPLFSADGIVGLLVVHTLLPAAQIGAEEEMAILSLADQSVMSLERTRLEDRVRRTQAETEALYTISKDFSFVLGPAEGLQRLAERALKVLEYDVVVILVHGTSGGTVVQASSGTNGTELRSGEELADADIVTPPRSLVFDDLVADTNLGRLYARLVAEGIVSAIVVPMRANGHDVGVLVAGNRVRHASTSDQVFLAERISHQTAIAIENSRLLRSELETVARLRQLDNIMSTVIRSASHELRTPMAAIKGYTELVIETAEPVLEPRQLKQLQTVSQQTDRVLKIIDNIITISALEDGRLIVEPVAMDAGELIDAMVLTVGAEAAAREISVHVDANADRIPVLADRRAIEIVLLNLLDNALKFTPAGGDVCLSACPEGDRVRFSVSDSGRGVRAPDRPHIFEKFHRGGTVLDDAVPGIGLGLAICQGIVALHGGELGLQHTSSQGACFWFTLPKPADQG